MLRKDMLPYGEMPELAFGSVWLVTTAGGDLRKLPPMSVHALETADAVIHSPEIPREILDLVKPPRYCELATPARAIARSVKLAGDGWRVVHLVDGDAAPANECATRLAEQGIPFRIASSIGEPAGDAIGLLLVRQSLSVGGSETGTTVMLVAAAQSQTPTDCERRQPPLSFSMSGLAG